MSIITFWNDGEKETGQTMSMAAIATRLSMKHNFKTLLINTKHNDSTLEDGFWGANTPKAKTDIVTGLSGLTKAIMSNKTSPEIITNYTRAMFKGGRLELLTDKKIDEDEYEKQKKAMKTIVKMANKYYDLVFVDLEGSLEEDFVIGMLDQTNLIIPTMTQRIQDINKHMKYKAENEVLKKDNIMLLMGKYDEYSKYNRKNVEAYMKEKEIYVLPYSTMYMEACNQGEIVDYSFKFLKIKSNNIQAPFVEATDEISTKIIEKLRELQMKSY